MTEVRQFHVERALDASINDAQRVFSAGPLPMDPRATRFVLRRFCAFYAAVQPAQFGTLTEMLNGNRITWLNY